MLPTLDTKNISLGGMISILDKKNISSAVNFITGSSDTYKLDADQPV